MNTYVIATVKTWNIKEAGDFAVANPRWRIVLISDRKKLTYDALRKIDPEYIFFPHWSWMIPKEIYKNFKCVVFHMTDVPFGRGGSPLQNLIERGIYKTKISALKVVKGIDAGPVYLKRDLSLKGSAEEILRRASKIIFRDMIRYIIQNRPTPVSQKGAITAFKRRTPEQGNIGNLTKLQKIYDYIRMLDAGGYPPAFLDTAKVRLEFSKAMMKDNRLIARVSIIRKGES